MSSTADSLNQKKILLREVEKDAMEDIRRRDCKAGHSAESVRYNDGFGASKELRLFIDLSFTEENLGILLVETSKFLHMWTIVSAALPIHGTYDPA